MGSCFSSYKVVHAIVAVVRFISSWIWSQGFRFSIVMNHSHKKLSKFYSTSKFELEIQIKFLEQSKIYSNEVLWGWLLDK